MFSLAKSPKKYICPKCGKRTFTPYLADEGTGELLSDTVGRCDRQDKCGYHYTPKEYFRDHPERQKDFPLTEYRKNIRSHRQIFEPVNNPLTLSNKLVELSMDDCLSSDFVQFLFSVFPSDKVVDAVNRYFLGCNDQGRVVYWQIDQKGRVRDGKIVPYDTTTGHRINDSYTHINWVSSRLRCTAYVSPTWQHSQCFFGQHLLNGDKYPQFINSPVAVVEAEKTAVICSIAFPKIMWLSCGGKSNLESFLRMEGEHLKGRIVQVCPDKGCYNDWKNVVDKYKPYLNISTDKSIEGVEALKDGGDYADVVISSLKPHLCEQHKENTQDVKQATHQHEEGVIPVPFLSGDGRQLYTTHINASYLTEQQQRPGTKLAQYLTWKNGKAVLTTIAMVKA